MKPGLTTALCWACLWSFAAHSQTYPTKPIQLIVPLQAGSAGDTALRIVAQRMSESMKQQIVIENQPGAAGLIGAQRVARMTADGYVAGGFSDSVLNYAPSLTDKPGFDPVNDFAAVSFICSIPWVLIAHPSFPAKTVPELVRLAKSSPGRIDYASAGNGSPHHVVMELFKRANAIDLHHVPYRGAAQSVTDVVAGEVPVAFSAIAVPLPFIRQGRVRAIAVPGEQRSPLLPDVPTMAAQGVRGFVFNTWLGVFVPKGVPKAVIDRLNGEIAAALKTESVRERLLALSLEPRSSTPDELAKTTRDGLARVAKVIKDAGIKAD
jgi:tripartite-type tricarboxylate transporter receptor subunit TctC